MDSIDLLVNSRLQIPEHNKNNILKFRILSCKGMKRYIIFEDFGLDVSLTETSGMQSWAKRTENHQKLD